jgi:dienelactone hydrolase
MRRAAAISAAVVAGVALAAGGAVIWLRSGDPLARLPRERGSSAEVVEERREPWHGRTLVHVLLEGRAVGPVRFVVSLPEPMPRTPIPLVVVLGGLRGGSESIRDISRVVGDPGENAFVGYDWPLPTREPGVVEILIRLPEYRRNVLSVPGQVDAILAWALRTGWADPSRVSLLGFSLGAFVAPASQRLAEQRGVAVRWTILAYAGAPIGEVIAGHPNAGPPWARAALGAGADLLLRPIEPSAHLPHLRGRFLVLGATTDRLIARAAAERMEALTPEPRTIVRIEGDHMGRGAERWTLLARVVDVSRSWLVEQGAIDAPIAAPARR